MYSIIVYGPEFPQHVRFLAGHMHESQCNAFAQQSTCLRRSSFGQAVITSSKYASGKLVQAVKPPPGPCGPRCMAAGGLQWRLAVLGCLASGRCTRGHPPGYLDDAFPGMHGAPHAR